MKNRRKRDGGVSWSRFFWFTILVVLSCVIFSGSFFFIGNFRPIVKSTMRSPKVKAVSGDSTIQSAFSIREAVKFPDQTLVFLKYPPSVRLFTKEELLCVFSSGVGSNLLKEPPSDVDHDDDLGGQIVRCPASPHGHTVSVVVSRSTADVHVPAGPTHRWDWLAYNAVIDYDNSTVVFVKGLNLRPGRVSDASRYECVYGWDLTKPKLLLRSEVISAAQEIVRCKTPLSVLDGPQTAHGWVKVSVRIKGSRLMLSSVAHPVHSPGQIFDPTREKPFEMCVCTMMRNGAKFLREWVVYHARVGVQRWFIYDNNSDDNLIAEISDLYDCNYNISRHFWPWIKTQEAGFAHCAIRACSECNWVGFIDVDEFFYLPSGLTVYDVIKNYSTYDNVGEIRTLCHSFGPSGLNYAPRHAVTVAYTCRLAVPERHKSIVRPEALNPTLMNVVHHFHLKDTFDYADVDKDIMVINHYKYQVWEVFKEKFTGRVATYVADWQEDDRVRSKDRVPGLGTRPIEPVDWANRFCEVRDYGLRHWVLEKFSDNKTFRLLWQERDEKMKDEIREDLSSGVHKRIARKRRKRLKAH